MTSQQRKFKAASSKCRGKIKVHGKLTRGYFKQVGACMRTELKGRGRKKRRR